MTTDDIRSSSPTTTTVGPGPAMGPGLPLGIYTNHFGKGCRKNSRGSYSGECNFLDPSFDQVRHFFSLSKFDLLKVERFFLLKKFGKISLVGLSISTGQRHNYIMIPFNAR